MFKLGRDADATGKLHPKTPAVGLRERHADFEPADPACQGHPQTPNTSRAAPPAPPAPGGESLAPDAASTRRARLVQTGILGPGCSKPYTDALRRDSKWVGPCLAQACAMLEAGCGSSRAGRGPRRLTLCMAGGWARAWLGHGRHGGFCGCPLECGVC